MGVCRGVVSLGGTAKGAASAGKNRKSHSGPAVPLSLRGTATVNVLNVL